MYIFVNNRDSIAEDKSPGRRQLLFSDMLIHRSAPLPELHSFPSILPPPLFSTLSIYFPSTQLKWWYSSSKFDWQLSFDSCLEKSFKGTA